MEDQPLREKEQFQQKKWVNLQLKRVLDQLFMVQATKKLTHSNSIKRKNISKHTSTLRKLNN